MNAIQSRHAALNEARLQLQRVEALQAANDNAPEAAESPLAGLRQAFEDTSAAHALGEATDVDLDSARLALEQASAAELATTAQREHAAAMRAGIARRLANARDAVERASAEMVAEQVAWVNAELGKADADYVEHARAAAAALMRVEALKAWLQRAGHAVPGIGVWRAELKAPVLGAVSLEAAKLAYPSDANAGHIWHRDVFRRFDSAAANKAIELELASLSEPPTQAPGAGESLLAAGRRLVRKMAA
jgi:hypothetical protein